VLAPERSLCIVPALAGDPALPGQVLREVGHQTLLSRAVMTARHSGVAARVLVATDDRLVARRARALGATLVILPENGGGGVSLDTVVDRALAAAARHGWDVDRLFTLDPAFPLVPPDLLSRAATRLSLGDVDCVVTVTHERTWAANGAPTGRLPLMPDLRVNDAVHATTSGWFRAHGRLASGRQGYVLLAASRSLRVRCLEDLARAHRLATEPAASRVACVAPTAG